MNLPQMFSPMGKMVSVWEDHNCSELINYHKQATDKENVLAYLLHIDYKTLTTVH